MRYINRDGGTPSLITGSFSVEQTPGQETIEETDADYLDWLNKQGNYLLDYAWHRVHGSPKYAPQGEQNDMGYWDRLNGTTTLDDHLTAVKAAHRKA